MDLSFNAHDQMVLSRLSSSYSSPPPLLCICVHGLKDVVILESILLRIFSFKQSYRAIEQRGGTSFSPSVCPPKCPDKRPNVRPIPPGSTPQTPAPWPPPGPSPLDTLPRPPATPHPRSRLSLESPCPPWRGRNSRLIGHRPLWIRCPA